MENVSVLSLLQCKGLFREDVFAAFLKTDSGLTTGLFLFTIPRFSSCYFILFKSFHYSRKDFAEQWALSNALISFPEFFGSSFQKFHAGNWQLHHSDERSSSGGSWLDRWSRSYATESLKTFTKTLNWLWNPMGSHQRMQSTGETWLFLPVVLAQVSR